MRTAVKSIIFHQVGRFLPARVRRYSKLLLSAEYREEAKLSRELNRLKALPRYQKTTTYVLGFPIEVPDGHSFVEMYGEIFHQQMYAFHSKRFAPFIIDGGANIGLSILYFKKLYPASEIVAFEPEGHIFDILMNNIRSSRYGNIDLVRRALSATGKPIHFMSEGSYAGRISRGDDRQDTVVETIRLREYLNRPVDLLKLNIEGAETEVLEDCQDLLGNVENIALEYHSFEGQPQTFHKLINILTNAGFRLHILPSRSSPQPLLRREVLLGMDLQLYLFAFRP